MGDPLAVMLEARSVALVGASARPGSLGARMITEMGRSPSRPRTYLVNPRYDVIGDARCYPTMQALPEAVDLALFAVPDAALADAVAAGVAAGARSGLVFGSAVGARDRIAALARSRMPLCGAGCMGFVNAARGLRVVGYLEADPLPSGPVALVTHSGSVFSALLRTRRAFGFTVAVSSGQELVTTAAEYARYALTLPETKVVALVLETVRSGPRVVVCAMAPPGVELILGIARDPSLGPLLVLGAGGVLAELLAERSVALPPVSMPAARVMLGRLRAGDVLSGARGRPPSDVDAVAAAVSALSVLATELGDALDALDINPLACGPSGVLALDVLAVPRCRGYAQELAWM